MIKVGLRLHFWIWKLPLTNFKMKVELPSWSANLPSNPKVELPTWSAILPSNHRLTLTIFIANMFHKIAKTINIFDLHPQFFADKKIFWIRKSDHYLQTLTENKILKHPIAIESCLKTFHSWANILLHVS